MSFDKQWYTQEFTSFVAENRIRQSRQLFKVPLFLQRAENSLQIAEHMKEMNPTKDQPKKLHWSYWAITISYYSMLYAAKAAILSKGYEVRDHDSAQIALGYLLVPSKLEQEDLEYVQFFETAKKESHIARYVAIKKYTDRQLVELFDNAMKFVGKISLMVE